MKYENSLIHITHTPEVSDTMYSIICLHAHRLNLVLNGIRCYLDGKYLLCLSTDDTLSVEGGTFEAMTLHFRLFFYNVNLNHNVIALPMYEEMRSRYGYPDFHLFRERDASYEGILPLSDDEYAMVRDYLTGSERYIENHETDGMWSCRVRSDMISVLRIAEGVYFGETTRDGSDIIRYIRDHIGEEITLAALCQHFNTNRTTLANQIKSITGMSPMQYILEERLNQSRPELLFTKVPIQELAEKYGFSDSNYYIRAFRKRFGLTPLQYRTQGFAERIRNEIIYHRREEEMMKISEFKEYIEKGLGRGLLLLQKEPDKTPYRKALVDYYTKDTFHLRRGSVYDAELIRCFEDSDALSAEIAVSLFESLKNGKKCSMIPMLVELGYKDTVTAIIEYMYSKSHKELLEYTKSGASGDTPDCVTLYFQAVVGLALLKVPRERMKQALMDMADFYNYASEPPIPATQNPMYCAADAYGVKEMFALADEVEKEHPHGKGLNDKRGAMLDFDTPKYSITAEQVFSSYTGELYYDWDMVIAFAHASDDVLCAVAEEILREEDPMRRTYLLGFFNEQIPGYLDPMFPLDPAPIIAQAQKLKPFTSWEEDRIKNAVVAIYYSFLGKIRHPDVKALGMKLLEDQSLDPYMHDLAAKMVFGANFEPQDTPIFLDYLKSAPHWNGIVEYALNMKMELPDEVLEFSYGAAKNERVSLVRTMIKKGRLPQSIREECQYDANIYIRKLVSES